MRGLDFLLFLKPDTKWDNCALYRIRNGTLVINSEMPAVGSSSKRKLPSLDLILTSFGAGEKGVLWEGESTDHDERQEERRVCGFARSFAGRVMARALIGSGARRMAKQSTVIIYVQFRRYAIALRCSIMRSKFIMRLLAVVIAEVGQIKVTNGRKRSQLPYSMLSPSCVFIATSFAN